MQHAIIILLAAVAVLSCSSTTNSAPPPPRNTTAIDNSPVSQWRQSRSDSRYPTDRFLVSIGVGPTSQAAIDHGRRELLAFFSTQIDAINEVRSTQIISATDGIAKKIQESHISRDILSAKVAGNLIGAKVAETAVDANGLVYALIVIEREPFRNELRRRIENRIEEIQLALYSASQQLADNKFLAAYRQLIQIKEMFLDIDAWTAQFNLTNRSQIDVPLDSLTEFSRWFSLMQSCARHLTFFIAFDCQLFDDYGRKYKMNPGATIEAVKGTIDKLNIGAAIVNIPELASLSAAEISRLDATQLKSSAKSANILILGEINVRLSSRFGAMYVFQSDYVVRIREVHSSDEWAADISGVGAKDRPHANQQIAAQNSLTIIAREVADKIAMALKERTP